MLTFLFLASKQGVDIVSYHDKATGHMEPSPSGKLWVSRVVLKPEIEYRGEAPSKELIDQLHHAAHGECFIANSVKSEITVE
jgi:organic hydroperoxide reductase OsmC/OhrA